MRTQHRFRIAGALAVFAVLIAALGHEARVAATDWETVTMGANDPTWSPDGTRLAFTLFGSIWQVPAKGGEAQQITTSRGYHAHPVWSPVGGRVAFVRGAPPAGRLPNVQGQIVVADLQTGAEQELTTEAPVTGSISWSPDGRKLVCALRTSDSGSVLHEVDVVTGKATRIQELPQLMRTASLWVNTAWNPKRAEIFFAAQRGGAPQIWSMKPAGVPMMVQSPLTRYQLEDIADIQAITALPDGSGVVFSANLVNARGNYELYRVSREGGVPVALTNTLRDEFSPAISPDGSEIAYASNQIGNLDLFTQRLSGSEPQHVRLTGLRFRRPSATLRVRTLDETGAATPVRLYVHASDGKAYTPSGSPVYYYLLEPGSGREGFFLTSGDDTVNLPAGPLRLTALKGFEYEVSDTNLDLAPGQSEVTLHMRRWTDWAKRGWQSGDNHFHANYNGSYYQRPAQSLRWLQAENLNTANMIAANSEGGFIHDREFFTGRVSSVSAPGHVLRWGQEFRNSYPLGHMAFLNIRELVMPSFTSVPGSNSPFDYPLNTTAALMAQEQGGLVSYVHPMGGGRDVFDTLLGAKEMPVTAALGAVDAVDVLPFGQTSYELWYRFLNSGFRISPGAGTDVFTNYRGINMIPGGSREYIESGSVMEWTQWIDRYRAGRVFVTNGPLLKFEANGKPPGSVVSVAGGSTTLVRLAVEIETRVPVDKVEFLRNGEVIAKEEYGQPRTGAFRAVHESQLDRSSWFAVRLNGPRSRGVADYSGGFVKAHSGVIYFEKDGEPILVRDDLELMVRWIDRLWALLEERKNFGSAENRLRARQVIQQARGHYVQKLSKFELRDGAPR